MTNRPNFLKILRDKYSRMEHLEHVGVRVAQGALDDGLGAGQVLVQAVHLGERVGHARGRGRVGLEVGEHGAVAERLLDALAARQLRADPRALDGRRALHQPPRAPLRLRRVLLRRVAAPEVHHRHLLAATVLISLAVRFRH